jgi:hypothetical protein
VRKRILAGFSMRHGVEGFHRVVYQLAQRDARSHALAIEWLDVTLTGSDRAAVAMLEPGWSDRERLTALVRTFPVARRSPDAWLVDLVTDPQRRWRRPWLAACAVYTASGMPAVDLDAVAAGTETPEHDGEGAAAIVHETLAGVRRRHLDPA